MLNLLASFGPSKYIMIGFGVVTAALGGLYLWSRVQIADLQNDLQKSQYEVVNLMSEVELQKDLSELNRQGNIMLSKRVSEERKENEALAQRIKEIQNAPETDNGSVSNVLRDSIERLPDDNG